MKNVSFISSGINGLDGQFKSLNNVEMFSLRGGKRGDTPPPPDGDGDLILPFGPPKPKKDKKNPHANQMPELTIY